MTAPDDGRYLPIEDYAAIGNTRTAALIGRTGSIDWCSLPELNDPSVFGALLDAERGGRFQVRLAGVPLGEQRYVGDSNVLETAFQAPIGRLEVTDCMPITGRLDGPEAVEPLPQIHRLLHAPGGDVPVEIEWAPRFDYARVIPHIERTADGYVAIADHQRLYLGGLPGDCDVDIVPGESGPVVRGQFMLAGGHSLALVTALEELPVASTERTRDLIDRTVAAWERWVHQPAIDRTWGEPWKQHLVRSELALKLMTHTETGAIAAAPTTSLPEVFGGVRNWDYRYCWIRDAAMTGDAFMVMGHAAEMNDYILWAERAAASANGGQVIRIMYGLHGEDPEAAQELSHLEGYRGSRPVRIGNDALDQLQPDVFGELLEAAWEYVRHGYRLDPDVRRFLPRVADRACEVWTQPDHGIWEMPLEPRHYTYSKLMTWVALDRALQLAADGWIEGDVANWRRSREAIQAWVLERGYDSEQNAFVQREDSPDLDASSLLIPVKGMLPPDDPRVLGTIDRTLEHLTEHGLVYRYRTDDGLPGEEGAFVLCSWWLVDALTLAGRVDEAEALFENLLGHVNHVGLLSEQIEVSTGRFLGNFPQALSHIGLIISTANLATARGLRVEDYPPSTNPVA